MIKLSVCMFLCLVTIQSYAQDNSNPYDVQAAVISEDGQFRIQASYEVPIDICASYNFITDYEGAKNIPGIVESKVMSRNQNKVRVQRLVREQILFFTIEIKSIIEYVEAPNKLLTFNQLSGDSKQYRGSWRLSESKGRTLFRYEAIFQPHSVIPSFVIEYFVRNSIRDRFEMMAQRAAQPKFSDSFSCN